jgi:hypothetical protein
MIRATAIVTVGVALGLVLTAGIFWIGIEIQDGHEDLTV